MRCLYYISRSVRTLILIILDEKLFLFKTLLKLCFCPATSPSHSSSPQITLTTATHPTHPGRPAASSKRIMETLFCSLYSHCQREIMYNKCTRNLLFKTWWLATLDTMYQLWNNPQARVLKRVPEGPGGGCLSHLVVCMYSNNNVLYCEFCVKSLPAAPPRRPPARPVVKAREGFILLLKNLHLEIITSLCGEEKVLRNLYSIFDRDYRNVLRY